MCGLTVRSWWCPFYLIMIGGYKHLKIVGVNDCVLTFLLFLLSSGTMDLSAPAPVVALLHWPHLLFPISSTFSSLIYPSSLLPHPLLPQHLWPSRYPPARPTWWQGRKARLSEAPWTSSAWRASSREERAAFSSLTAGRFLSTMHRMFKERLTFVAPSWWRGDYSRTRCLSLSYCNLMARWRWVRCNWQVMLLLWQDVMPVIRDPIH